MTVTDKLVVAIEDGVGILQLRDPARRNALGRELHDALLEVLGRWRTDDAVTCVLFVGDESTFCSGWALDELERADGDARRRFVDLAHRLMREIYDYPKPTVAAVAGPALGYGMDVANMCDVTIAATNAYFGSTQVKYAMTGFYHGLMRRVGQQRARRMLFTGDPVDAAEAFRTGLVDELVEPAELRDRALLLARRIAEMGPELGGVLKGVALTSSTLDHVSSLTFELSVTHDLTQREIFKQRTPAGLKRLREGRSLAVERLGR